MDFKKESAYYIYSTENFRIHIRIGPELRISHKRKTRLFQNVVQSTVCTGVGRVGDSIQICLQLSGVA